MNNLDSRSPAWLSDDEPLPIEVRDALRLADQEDGQADQIARLEARLAPLFLSPSPPANEGAASAAQSTGRSLFSAGSMLSAGAALLGLAALVWPPRELALRNRGSLAASYPRDAESELPPRPLKALEFAPLQQAVPSEAVAAERTLAEPALAKPAAKASVTYAAVANTSITSAAATSNAAASNAAASNAAASNAAASNAATNQVTRALPVGKAARAAGHEQTDANALALEARLLSRARQALEQAPADALRLTERHRTHFPNGVLVEEREAIAIKAMRKAGLEEAATARFKQFLARFPESPHARKLDSAARPSHVNP